MVSDFSSSEIIQERPTMIMLAPHHHIRLVFSPKIKVPITADTIKLDAVDITVGTNVLASLA